MKLIVLPLPQATAFTSLQTSALWQGRCATQAEHCAPVPQRRRPEDSPATVFALLYPPWAGSEKMSSAVSHGPCYCRQPRQRKAGFETVPRVVGCGAHEMICPTAVWTTRCTTYLRQATRLQSACTSNLGTGTPNPSNNIWKENSPNTELKKKN